MTDHNRPFTLIPALVIVTAVSALAVALAFAFATLIDDVAHRLVP